MLAILQFEVKTYPQSGAIEEKKLVEAIEKAAHQLRKGRDLFLNVLAPLAKISEPWTITGLIFLPNVNSRADLNCLELDPEQLRCILTAEQLKSDDWLTGLDLGTVEASASDYDQLGAIFVGSEYVGYKSQGVDHQREAEQRVDKSLERIAE